MQKQEHSYKGIIAVLVVLLVSVIGIITYFILTDRDTASNLPSITSTPSPPISSIESTSKPSPTPFPFREMTIPYLRERSYQSQLSDLQEYRDYSDYIAYLTSYESDGYNINGLLTIPKGQQPEGGWPAVVFVHGYIPPQEYTTTGKYNDYVDFLARRGMVVFKIDLRGHGQSEGTAFGAYYSPDYVIDTLNAHSALENQDYIDSDRVGLWGHSMAGNVVFRSFVASEKVNRVVIWAGAVYSYEDFEDFRIQDSSYQPPPEESERRQRRQELFDTYGDFSADDPFWRQVVPTNYLDGKSGSVQIHHAQNDNVVDIRYSRNLIDILEGSQINNRLYKYQSGGHNITGSSFVTAMQRSAEFLSQ